jgi:outer membrane receptor for ferrienterochelin and colicins
LLSSVIANTGTAQEKPKAPEATQAARAYERADTEALARSLDLGELLSAPVEVVAATKVHSSLDEAPAAMVVYDREDIRAWGYQSVAEILQHALGFYVIDDQSIPNVAVRGISGGMWSESGILKVMLDGHSVAFRATGGNFLGPELVPVTAIERIEVIRGPASALYGADAFLGVVNIITRRGAELSGAELTGGMHIDGDSRLGFDQDIAVGDRFGDVEVILSYRHNQRNLTGLRLPKSSPAPNIPEWNGGTVAAKGLERESHVGYAAARYHLDKTTFTLSLYGVGIEREAAFSPWVQLAHGRDALGRDNHNTIAVHNGHAALKVESELTPDLSIVLDAMYFQGAPSKADHIETTSPTFYVERDFAFSGVDTNLELHYRVHPDVQTVVGSGIIVDHEELLSTRQILKADTATLSEGTAVGSQANPEGEKTFLNPSAYGLAIWDAWRNLVQLTGGLRYDYHNVYGSQVSGRGAVVVTPLPRLYVKALYGKAFKAPSPLLLYGVPLRPGDISGSPTLKPQHVHTWEGQVSYSPLDFVTVSSGLVYSYIINKAEFTQRGLNQVAENLAEVGAWTSESSVRFRYRRWLDAYGTLEYNRARRNLGREGYVGSLLTSQAVIYPWLLAHVGVAGSVPQVPLRLTVEGTYAGSRRATDENTIAAGERYSLPAYQTLDLSLSTINLRFFRSEETVFSAVVRNVTDVVAADPGFAGVDYPRLGRTFFIQARQNL